MKKSNIGILLGSMCCLLTIGICVQVKTVSSTTTTVGRTQMENGLRDSVLRWKEKYDNAYAKLEKEEKELENLREQASNTDDSASDMSNRLSEYNSLLGYTSLKGTGIVVTLDDGEATTTKMLTSDIIVHDADLLEVVNDLKNSGAEAIAINDQRIVSTTAITCAGNIIKINGEKVGAPFVIHAIGPTLKMYGAITRPGGYLELLEEVGVKVKVEQVEKSTIEVPKYEGAYKFEYATNVE